jgi:hypothetical protein
MNQIERHRRTEILIYAILGIGEPNIPHRRLERLEKFVNRLAGRWKSYAVAVASGPSPFAITLQHRLARIKSCGRSVVECVLCTKKLVIVGNSSWLANKNIGLLFTCTSLVEQY